jgi:hypothetical protein
MPVQQKMFYDDDNEQTADTEVSALRSRMDTTNGIEAEIVSELQAVEVGYAEPVDAKGYVYFAETEDESLVKIGFSVTPTRRLRQLGTLMPLRLIGCFPGSMDTEAWLHRKFAQDRTTGEWFRSTVELRTLIAMLGLITPARPQLQTDERTDRSPIDPDAPGKRVSVNVTELGKRGGKARVAAMTATELSKSASNASNARWEEYYRLHPEKLEERKRRDAARIAAQKRKAKKAGKKK